LPTWIASVPVKFEASTQAGPAVTLLPVMINGPVSDSAQASVVGARVAMALACTMTASSMNSRANGIGCGWRIVTCTTVGSPAWGPSASGVATEIVVPSRCATKPLSLAVAMADALAPSGPRP
jgi:hypothetical protein